MFDSVLDVSEYLEKDSESKLEKPTLNLIENDNRTIVDIWREKVSSGVTSKGERRSSVQFKPSNSDIKWL